MNKFLDQIDVVQKIAKKLILGDFKNTYIVSGKIGEHDINVHEVDERLKLDKTYITAPTDDSDQSWAIYKDSSEGKYIEAKVEYDNSIFVKHKDDDAYNASASIRIQMKSLKINSSNEFSKKEEFGYIKKSFINYNDIVSIKNGYDELYYYIIFSKIATAPVIIISTKSINPFSVYESKNESIIYCSIYDARLNIDSYLIGPKDQLRNIKASNPSNTIEIIQKLYSGDEYEYSEDEESKKIVSKNKSGIRETTITKKKDGSFSNTVHLDFENRSIKLCEYGIEYNPESVSQKTYKSYSYFKTFFEDDDDTYSGNYQYLLDPSKCSSNSIDEYAQEILKDLLPFLKDKKFQYIINITLPDNYKKSNDDTIVINYNIITNQDNDTLHHYYIYNIQTLEGERAAVHIQIKTFENFNIAYVDCVTSMNALRYNYLYFNSTKIFQLINYTTFNNIVDTITNTVELLNGYQYRYTIPRCQEDPSKFDNITYGSPEVEFRIKNNVIVHFNSSIYSINDDIIFIRSDWGCIQPFYLSNYKKL